MTGHWWDKSCAGNHSCHEAAIPTIPHFLCLGGDNTDVPLLPIESYWELQVEPGDAITSLTPMIATLLDGARSGSLNP